MLAPGSRQNQSSGAPLMRQGYSQINVDGQQVTTNFIGLVTISRASAGTPSPNSSSLPN